MLLWQRTLFKDSCYKTIYYTNKFNIILASSGFQQCKRLANMIDGSKHRTPLSDFSFSAARKAFYSSTQSIPSICYNSTLTTRKYGFQKLDLSFALFLKRAAKLELVATSTRNWMVKS